MICAVILAAGESRRLGTPKQLLEIHGRPLIRFVSEIACESGCEHVVVVTGANAEQATPKVDNLPVTVVFNKDWKDGKASSIRAGMATVLESHPDCDGILFLAIDQPAITVDLLDSMLNLFDAARDTFVACSYAGTVGIPAIIPRHYFSELKELENDHGAREILLEHADNVETIPFEGGAFDIDTIEDKREMLGED